MRETTRHKHFMDGLRVLDERELGWLCVGDGGILRPPNGSHLTWAEDELPAAGDNVSRHFVGHVESRRCFAIDGLELGVASQDVPFVPLRTLHAELDGTAFSAVSSAVQLVDWGRTSRHCGRCGTRTAPAREHSAFECPTCGLLAFPRIAPAIIVLVEREDRILLARSPTFPDPFYAPLAGFVEPAETLEDAVRREVTEEVGLQLEQVRYIMSQPWPYPHTLLAAFTAQALTSRLEVDSSELMDARWFGAKELPRLPPKFSISRTLVDRWSSAREASTTRPEV